MIPGSDLTAVALPVLPAGHRWVIDKKTKIHDYNWADHTVFKTLGISLERQEKTIFGNLKWKRMESRELKPSAEHIGGSWASESLLQCAERLAREIYNDHLKQLERRLEEELIVGIYQNKALPN